MKRKSPKNYRRKKRATARRYLGTSTWLDTDTTLYHNASPNTTTTTVTFPTSSFGSGGFVAGDIVTVSGATEPKRSKKVHVARRRIPKRSKNGDWSFGGITEDNFATVDSTPITGNWTFNGSALVTEKDENDK